jgi:hypothetical protein
LGGLFTKTGIAGDEWDQVFDYFVRACGMWCRGGFNIVFPPAPLTGMIRIDPLRRKSSPATQNPFQIS